MVENIEYVRPELKVDPLGKWCGFGQGEVYVGKSRPRNDISPDISAAGKANECRFIEEQVGRWIVQPDGLSRYQIRTIECDQAAASVRQQRENRTERISRLQIHNW